MRVGSIAVPALALISLSACGPEPVYLVRRAALVSHPTPPLRTGAPMTEVVEISARSSTVIMPITPREAQDANSGLWVARTNLAGSVRFRASARWDVGLLFETGLRRGAMAVADDSLVMPDVTAVNGGGVTAQYAIPLSKRVSLGIAVDFLLIKVPYHEVVVCLENCEAATHSGGGGRELTGLPRIAFLPSYRDRGVTVYGGVTLVGHPVVAKTQVLGEWSPAIDDRVDSGPTYGLLSAGLDYRVTSVLHLFAEGFVPVTETVVRYGPSIGFGLRLSLGAPN